jgi:tRNA(fMet)-specific endonuclease VapC
MKLLQRLNESGRPVATTVVSVEENLRGWMAQIRSATTHEREIMAYHRFQKRVEFFADWLILPWDADAVAAFTRFRSQSVRVGTQDLRIAAITLAHDATLLTRNAVDFAKVPGLRFENWLD